jgi:glycine oxidase
MPAEVLVVGGGVIGLSCAWQLAAHGHPVTLVAPDPGHDGAAWVAGGMLAPVAEAQFGEQPLTRLLTDGAGRWKEFAVSLELASGHDIGYDQSGTLTVALSPSDRAALDDLAAYQLSLGLTAVRRTASECRSLVPALSPAVCGGVEVPDDHRVDNRALLGALVKACAVTGVRTTVGRVTALSPGPVVVLSDGGRLGADCVLLAAGVGTPHIGGLEEAGLPEIRPVKGHILRLGPTSGSPHLGRTVRGLVRGRSVYLVPRPDCSVVVGATVEERGHDTTVQAGAVHQLLNDARAVVPGIDEMVLQEAAAGLRPSTADNTPVIGWTGLPGVAVACGHYRNGILLAPLTAETVLSLLDQGPVPQP